MKYWNIEMLKFCSCLYLQFFFIIKIPKTCPMKYNYYVKIQISSSGVWVEFIISKSMRNWIWGTESQQLKQQQQQQYIHKWRAPRFWNPPLIWNIQWTINSRFPSCLLSIKSMLIYYLLTCLCVFFFAFDKLLNYNYYGFVADMF